MGMYTEFVFGARLKKEVPQYIIEMLKVMFKHNDCLPSKYSDWNDKFPDIRIIPFGGSYYFGVQDSLSRLSYDTTSEDWTVCIRCNIKNYGNQICNFIKWIEPWVCEGSGKSNFLGYSIYEEDCNPQLYFIDEKTGKIVREIHNIQTYNEEQSMPCLNHIASPTWFQLRNCKIERTKNKTLSLCPRECVHENYCKKIGIDPMYLKGE